MTSKAWNQGTLETFFLEREDGVNKQWFQCIADLRGQSTTRPNVEKKYSGGKSLEKFLRGAGL